MMLLSQAGMATTGWYNAKFHSWLKEEQLIDNLFQNFSGKVVKNLKICKASQDILFVIILVSR